MFPAGNCTDRSQSALARLSVAATALSKALRDKLKK
jgi:hypothetical protein